MKPEVGQIWRFKSESDPYQTEYINLLVEYICLNDKSTTLFNSYSFTRQKYEMVGFRDDTMHRWELLS